VVVIKVVVLRMIDDTYSGMVVVVTVAAAAAVVVTAAVVVVVLPSTFRAQDLTPVAISITLLIHIILDISPETRPIIKVGKIHNNIVVNHFIISLDVSDGCY